MNQVELCDENNCLYVIDILKKLLFDPQMRHTGITVSHVS